MPRNDHKDHLKGRKDPLKDKKEAPSEFLYLKLAGDVREEEVIGVHDHQLLEGHLHGLGVLLPQHAPGVDYRLHAFNTLLNVYILLQTRRRLRVRAEVDRLLGSRLTPVAPTPQHNTRRFSKKTQQAVARGML